MKKLQRTTTKAIIRNGSKVLLVKDNNNVWELPGGRIEFGESPEEALKRELKEELGAEKVSVGNPISTFSFVSKTDIAEYHFIVLVYSCSAQLEEIELDHESTDFGWFGDCEISKLNMRDEYKRLINQITSL